MTSIFTSLAACWRATLVVAGMCLLVACGSGSSKSKATQASFASAPSPAVAMPVGAGPKTITNDLGDVIVLQRAYLVMSNVTMETDCTGTSFFALFEQLLDVVIPVAHAHTTATPTSTGIPVVVDLLGADNVVIDLGETSPPVGDYCGLTLTLDTADSDAANLPDTAAGEPDMVGRSLYMEGTQNGIPFSFEVMVQLIERKLLLMPSMSISESSRSAAATIGINYDFWFQGVDPAGLDDTDLSTPDSNQLLQNVTNSIHQL